MPAVFVLEVIGKLGTFAAEIDEIVTQQDTVHLRIVIDMPAVRAAIRFAVKGIPLPPTTSGWKINVVASTLLAAAVPNGLFLFETRVGVILREGHGIGDSHRVDDVATMSYCAMRTSATDHPVSDSGVPSYKEHTCGESADTVKRIRCETAIVSKDVRINAHFTPEQ